VLSLQQKKTKKAKTSPSMARIRSPHHALLTSAVEKSTMSFGAAVEAMERLVKSREK
jgi:hypothetical protein